MDIRFDDKVVLVTGASGGIGSAIARAFGSSGAVVAVHFNNDERGADRALAAIQAVGGSGFTVGGDLASTRGPREVVEGVRSTAGRIDVLVNNSGSLLRRGPIAEFEDDLFDAVMAVNFASVFRTCRAAIPVLKAGGGGSIVNVSSVAARNGGGGSSVIYASAKAAVSTFTRGLAKELVPFNIRVNAIAPGFIETPFHDATPLETRRLQVGTIPAGRSGTPEECAGVVLLLACESAASFITGQCIEVNGGQLMP